MNSGNQLFWEASGRSNIASNSTSKTYSTSNKTETSKPTIKQKLCNHKRVPKKQTTLKMSSQKKYNKQSYCKR